MQVASKAGHNKATACSNKSLCNRTEPAFLLMLYANKYSHWHQNCLVDVHKCLRELYYTQTDWQTNCNVHITSARQRYYLKNGTTYSYSDIGTQQELICNRSTFAKFNHFNSITPNPQFEGWPMAIIQRVKQGLHISSCRILMPNSTHRNLYVRNVYVAETAEHQM